MTILAPSGTLFAGITTPLRLNCSISIDSAVDTPVTVSVTWLRGDTQLSNNTDGRITISPLSGSQPSLTSTLTLSPLSTEDNTSFTCRAGALSVGFSSLTTGSNLGEGTIILPVECEYCFQ